MIIMLHYLDKGGILPKLNTAFGGPGCLAWLLEAYCLMAVNVYVLLSGYFGVESRFHIRKVWTLWGQVFFYSVGIALVCFLTGIVSVSDITIYRLFGYVFPIVTEHYWFATAYVFLFFLMPFLNAGAKRLEQKQFRAVLTGLLLFTCAAKTLIPMQLPTDRKGYDALWFVVVYLVGAYLRMYARKDWHKKGWLLFGVSGFSLFSLTMGLRFLWMRTGMLENFLNYAYSYNHILCLSGAVGLLLAFEQVKIKGEKLSDWICGVSGCTFGVYLIHEHLDLRYMWQGWFGTQRVAGSFWFLPCMLVTVSVVFAVCAAVEFLRKRIFGIVVSGVKRQKVV